MGHNEYKMGNGEKLYETQQLQCDCRNCRDGLISVEVFTFVISSLKRKTQFVPERHRSSVAADQPPLTRNVCN